MEFLSEENLHRLNTKRLLALFKSVRTAITWNRHWDNINKAIEYKKLIKKLLETREHVERTKN